MRQTATQGHDGGRSALVVYCVCAVYLYCLGALVAWTVLPVISGMTPTLIVSDSMAPRINAGDVVVITARAGSEIAAGNVITFKDPGRPSRLLTHRVTAVNPDGTLHTRGDANATTDSSAVPLDDVVGVGRILVPAVGVPLMWVRTGAWLQILGWIAGTALASYYVRAFGRRLPRLVSWTSSLQPAPSPEAAPPVRATPVWEKPLPSRPRLRTATASGVVLVLAAVAVLAPRLISSEAAFSDTTRNPDNQITAATSFCANAGSYTLYPVADTSAAQDATVYAATDPLLSVVSRSNNRNVRGLLRFTLPSATGCTVSATLRVNVTATSNSRTLQVANAAGAWTEGSATWAAAAVAAGSPVAPLASAVGSLNFPVTPHVQALYAGTNNGFVLSDTVETSGNNLISISSREAATVANRPQLLLTLGGSPSRPSAPTGLAATATSASRIQLSWVDTSSDETAFTVQRREPSGTWQEIANLAAGATSYLDTGLPAATAYEYRVRSVNAQGGSAWSGIAQATTQAAPETPPAAPTMLVAAATGVNGINLSWTDNATDEDSFTIDVSPAGAGTWTTAGTASASATTFSVTGLAGNTAYDFRVRAESTAGASGWSNTASASTATCASVAPVTLASTGDAMVAEAAPGSTLGTVYPTTLMTRSQSAANIRSVVQFAAPVVPLGCSIATATLRLNVSSFTSPRVLHAHRADRAWTEDTVTWGPSMPLPTGTAVAATAAVGWVPFTVTDHVAAMLAGTNNGFLIKDATENAGTAIDTMMSPKEGPNPPELVITFQ